MKKLQQLFGRIAERILQRSLKHWSSLLLFQEQRKSNASPHLYLLQNAAARRAPKGFLLQSLPSRVRSTSKSRKFVIISKYMSSTKNTTSKSSIPSIVGDTQHCVLCLKKFLFRNISSKNPRPIADMKSFSFTRDGIGLGSSTDRVPLRIFIVSKKIFSAHTDIQQTTDKVFKKQIQLILKTKSKITKQN